MVADTVRHEVGLADTVVRSTRFAMLKTDREMLQQTIQDVGSQPGVEHIRIFNKRGVVMFSSDPQEISRAVDKQTAGCNGCHNGAVPATRLGTMEQARRFTNGSGHQVLAITAPIYNEGSCVSLNCHPALSEVSVLGTLDIGLTTAPLQASLMQLRVRMGFFCGMVLLLSVAGVSALLRRKVFLPLRGLVGYGDELNRGRVDTQCPQGIDEIEALGAFMRSQALALEQLRKQQQESAGGDEKKTHGQS
jgi:HAMP domain-containing protein